MPCVTYITRLDQSIKVDNAHGTLMSAAVENQVPGIGGDCGGVCSCGTCHVKVASEWMEKVGGAGKAEAGMLELEDEVSANSRLGCQVKLRDDLDGLVVHVVRA